jgi:hypothetical protein
MEQERQQSITPSQGQIKHQQTKMTHPTDTQQAEEHLWLSEFPEISLGIRKYPRQFHWPKIDKELYVFCI